MAGEGGTDPNAVTSASAAPVADAALVARVGKGDTHAFAELYRRHAGAVRTAVLDNVRDPDGIADVVQETFTRALSRLATLREPDRFRPWLLAIARHAAVDSRRHRNRVDDLEPEHAAALPAAQPSPETAASVRELGEMLDQGVATLTQRDATALSLVTHLGFGPEAVAAALGTTTGAAKVIVHRARRRVRDAVVLEVLVRAEGAGCEQFEALCGADDLLTAARHVKSCTPCQDAARVEVEPYEVDDPDSPA